MKSVVMTAYGEPDVLKLKFLEKPIPKSNEILVRIHATTVETGDCEIRRSQVVFPFSILVKLAIGVFKPRGNWIPGQQFSGIVENVGTEVETLSAGDAVFGPVEFFSGSCTEYTCVKNSSPLSIKPDNVSFEDAATITVGGANALHFIRLAQLNPNKRILIYGSTGAIGTYAVQLAKLSGAEVTAVCSKNKARRVKTLGADRTIHYDEVDFSALNETWDVVFDTIGKASYRGCLKATRPGGLFLTANPTFFQMIRAFWTSATTDKKVVYKFARYEQASLDYLRDLITQGELKAIVDDNIFSLEEIVKAHQYVDQRHKWGNVVIRIN